MFNMTALAMRAQRRGQRRQPAARRGHQADVAVDLAGRAGREAAGQVDHQRRARADVDLVRDRSAARASPRARLARAARRSGRSSIACWTIPDEELWAARQSLRTFLFNFIRERARAALDAGARQRAARRRRRRRCSISNTLTIGFARRFTGYKRPELIFSDPDRLARILTAPGRAVQIVFAGKAHPADDVGKHHLQRIYRRALDPKFGGRIAFVDDYDLHVAHFLVQGCDVWMNNPRKPLEASGTSGMKAAINGTPHMSIGDGWWAEGLHRRQRLADRGAAPTRTTTARRTGPTRRRCTRCSRSSSCRRSTSATHDGIPRRWLQIVKQSIRTVLPALQRAPDGQGIRARHVSAGGPARNT